jgi:hypothetical protein
LGHAQGSRFKASIRDGLNGVVEPVFAIGSRFKGSVRNGLNGAVGPGFAVGSRFKGSIRDGLNGAVGPGVGASFGGRLAGVRSPAATARLGLPRGLVAVGGGGRMVAGSGVRWRWERCAASLGFRQSV